MLARYARNKRLADTCYLWAFSALERQPRGPNLLRPTESRWRHPPPSSARPRQSPRRHPSWVPATPHPLRRGCGVGTPHQQGRLTSTARGMSRRSYPRTNRPGWRRLSVTSPRHPVHPRADPGPGRTARARDHSLTRRPTMTSTDVPKRSKHQEVDQEPAGVSGAEIFANHVPWGDARSSSRQHGPMRRMT